jgi:hypothetical protein
VFVKQETIAGQGVFVLKLTKLAEISDVKVSTVNATQQLMILHKRREKLEDISLFSYEPL